MYPRSVENLMRIKGGHPNPKTSSPLFEYLIKTYTNEGDLFPLITPQEAEQQELLVKTLIETYPNRTRRKICELFN